ncbi:hypothetical protein SSTG_05919 [Streptomyces sp. e14]|nr:hypothetical protein SSTG_05919 [Streptomyces sp. e14]
MRRPGTRCSCVRTPRTRLGATVAAIAGTAVTAPCPSRLAGSGGRPRGRPHQRP